MISYVQRFFQRRKARRQLRQIQKWGLELKRFHEDKVADLKLPDWL